jgi:NAD(P)H-flavin reductase
LVIVYGLSLLISAVKTYILSGFKHRATVKSHADGTFRVSIPTHISWNPGQHIFVRFFSGALGGAHALTNHPFSICSLPSNDKNTPNEIVFHIRPHSGITQALSTFAKEHPEESIPVMLEGPYGGVDKEALLGFERYLVIAGGSGSGSLLPVLETLMRRASRIAPPKDEEGAAGPAARLDVRVVCVVRHQG